MPTLTLGDLLDHRDLGLDMVCAPPKARDRPVVGAHSIEVQEPARWLPENWVMLTTGVQLRTGAMDARELITNISRGGFSALGFGVGVEFDEVPADLLDEAWARGFPVFSVPLPTPFREIIDFVNRSLLSTDLYTLRRVVSMQGFLMDALYEPQPREALLERLGSLLQGSAILFTVDGEVEMACGHAPPKQIWSGIAAHGGEQLSFPVHGWWVVAAPVISEGVTNGWLAAGVARAHSTTEVAKQIVRAASRIFGLVSTAQRLAVDEKRALGAALVRDLVIAPTSGTAVARAQALGFALDAAAYVAVIEATLAAPQALSALLVDAQQWLSSKGVPHAGTIDEHRIVLLVQGPHTLVEDWTSTAGADVRLRAGLSGAAPSLNEVSACLREAESAVRHLTAYGHDGRTDGSLRVDDLDLSGWLVAQIDGNLEIARRMAHELLAPLAAHPTLEQTLRVYLDCHLSVNQAAKRMHLHPNSLRYRLRRIEASLNRALDDPVTMANLHLAMLIERGMNTATEPRR